MMSLREDMPKQKPHPPPIEILCWWVADNQKKVVLKGTKLLVTDDELHKSPV